jgi:hypothetical protein
MTVGRPRWSRHRLPVAAATTGLVAGLLLVAGPTQPAVAAPAPVAAPTAAMVTTDSLPTTQIDGVVWSQTVVGRRVFAGGNFAHARPAGAAPGTDLTARGNLLAYNLATGQLDTSFAPSLNAQVRAVAASPDGSRLYVGGSFTEANGQVRDRLAAYDTATGALIASFAPALDATVNAIVATGNTVYVGGRFSSANHVDRARLAAFNASNGRLTGWRPTADNVVSAMVGNPAGNAIVVGGSFGTVNGAADLGLADLDLGSGASLPWNATNWVHGSGNGTGITSLRTDGNAVYATAFNFGGNGNLEGSAAFAPATGNLIWMEDCHGDTYDSYPTATAVYTVGHAHDCHSLGAFGDMVPAAPGETEHRALAFSSQPTGTLADGGGVAWTNHAGLPSPTLYNWFPNLAPGTFTGQGQAAWSLAGSGQYVVMGGEFPSVNAIGQQGLARFAVRPIGTDIRDIGLSGANYVPHATELAAGRASVSFLANWARDTMTLHYQVIRNGDRAHPIFTTTQQSTFWNRPLISFTDSGLIAGKTDDYQVLTSDDFGNTSGSESVALSASTLEARNSLVKRAPDPRREPAAAPTQSPISRRVTLSPRLGGRCRPAPVRTNS